MPKPCTSCGAARAAVKRPKTGLGVCQACFFQQFEDEVHATITTHALFPRGARVAVGVSGGKDSTVLAHILSLLNARHDYGLSLQLLAIDEGIAGYRDDALATVRRNAVQYDLPLTILSYADLYGHTMDGIASSTPTTSNCTFCGVLRRQALDRGAALLGADAVATGHNADDVAETALLNLLRGDAPRLARTAAPRTPAARMPRAKPFLRAYEKEIVMYAHFHRLDYFATECVYAPRAYRGRARELVKTLEALRPSAIADIVSAAETLTFPDATEVDELPAHRVQVERACVRCGFLTSQKVCKACTLVESLNNGSAATVNRRR